MIDRSALDYLFSQQTNYAKDIATLSWTGKKSLVSLSKRLIDGDSLVGDCCKAQGYLRLRSPDAIGLSKNKIFFIEFKTGFKDRAVNNGAPCPLLSNKNCDLFSQIFTEERNKQKKALVDHATSKAKDAFVFLSTMCCTPSNKKPVSLVYVAVSDAPSVDEFVMTAESLATPNNSFDLSSIQEAFRDRLLVRKNSPFFFDEVYCLTQHAFVGFLEKSKIIFP